MCSWSQLPAASQPAVVHEMPSVSPHGVLSGRMCSCTHTPASQPAVVHGLLSVSVHGVLSWTGTQRPLDGSHCPEHSSPGHVVTMCSWSHAPWPSQPAV